MITKLIQSIPDSFKDKQILMAENESIRWFRELPVILEKAISKWQLKDCEYFSEETFNSILISGFSEKYGDIILKVVHPSYELFINEVRALSFHNGIKTCKMFDYDESLYSLLLERLTPGTKLSMEKSFEKRVKTAVEIINEIAQPIHSVDGLTQYDAMLKDYFARVKKIACDNKALIFLIETAEKFYFDSDIHCYEKVIVHGDYHYGNIIQCKDEYKAIDPNGMVGYKFMDTAKLINNEMKYTNNYMDIEHLTKTIDLVSEELCISKLIISKWLFISSTLSVAGNVLYVKSEPPVLAAKMNKALFYLNTYKYYLLEVKKR